MILDEKWSQEIFDTYLSVFRETSKDYCVTPEKVSTPSPVVIIILIEELLFL